MDLNLKELRKQPNSIDSQKRVASGSQSGASSSSRRNSLSTNPVRIENHTTNGYDSAKSSADSRANLIENLPKRPPISNGNPASLVSAMNSSSGEPIQLFRKINELSTLRNNPPTNGNHHGRNLIRNSSIDNKKRISLLLARKS